MGALFDPYCRIKCLNVQVTEQCKSKCQHYVQEGPQNVGVFRYVPHSYEFPEDKNGMLFILLLLHLYL